MTQLGVPEFITGETSVFMDIMANFGTYFHQEEHRSEEKFLGVFLPRLQHTFPSGDPGTVCHDLPVEGQPKVSYGGSALSLNI